jgi:hypothetical protein
MEKHLRNKLQQYLLKVEPMQTFDQQFNTLTFIEEK